MENSEISMVVTPPTINSCVAKLVVKAIHTIIKKNQLMVNRVSFSLNVRLFIKANLTVLIDVVSLVVEIFHKLNPLVFSRVRTFLLAHFTFEIFNIFKALFFHPVG